MTINRNKSVLHRVGFIMLFCLFEIGTGNGGHKLHFLEKYIHPVLFHYYF